jgi:hypothetical protein
MVLEKHKVYKIFHNPISFGEPYPRNYLLVCPKNDLVIDDGFVKGKEFRMNSMWHNVNYRILSCIFIVCFDGGYSFDHESSICEDCYFGEINDNDLKDVRGAIQHMAKMGEKYQYNRKLNKIIEI